MVPSDVPALSIAANYVTNNSYYRSETLFGSLKVERLHGMQFATRGQVKDEVIDWLQFYYNRRLHSTLGYLSPHGPEHKELVLGLRFMMR